MGKSDFADYLKSKYNACRITTLCSKDALRAVHNHSEEFGFPTVIIIDIARAIEKIDSIYPIIEQLRSKGATSGKYDSKALDFPICPIIFVFANVAPDITKLTRDRWNSMVASPLTTPLRASAPGISTRSTSIHPDHPDTKHLRKILLTISTQLPSQRFQ